MFTLEIKTGNAAFRNPFTGEEDSECEAVELMNLLDKVKDELDDGKTSGVVKDTDGNKVGTWSR